MQTQFISLSSCSFNRRTHTRALTASFLLVCHGHHCHKVWTGTMAWVPWWHTERQGSLGSEPYVYPAKCQEAGLLDHSGRMEVITLSQPSHTIQPPPLQPSKGLLQPPGLLLPGASPSPTGKLAALTQRCQSCSWGSQGGEVNSHKPETQQMTPPAPKQC